MTQATRAGDVLADRYRLIDLLSESGGGRFWRAQDRVLERHVALHVIASDDPRADGLLSAARRSAAVLDPRILRVLDAVRTDDVCFVVNEWGSGSSLDIMLATNGPLPPRHSAFVVAEVADAMAIAHAAGVTHGRLVPENVLVDTAGGVRVIGLCVDAALHGLPPAEQRQDVDDLAGLLEATLTGRWAGPSTSAVPRVPTAHGRVLRPRQVRAGIPRALDDLCDELLNPRGARVRDVHQVGSARGIHGCLEEYVGDPVGLAEAIAAANPERPEPVSLPPVPEIPARPDPDDASARTSRRASRRSRTAPEPGPTSTPVRGVEAAASPTSTPRRGTPAADPAADPAGPGPAPAPAPTPAAMQVQPPPAPPGPPPGPPGPAELPTQAGLPIFDDENDDVSWLRARDEPSPPPPPFEEPPERPLFAPDPDDGAPVRKPRFPAPTYGPVPGGAHGDEYWPFDADRGTGSGVLPAISEPVADERVPGRSWLRAAGLVAVALGLVVVVAITINLSRGKTALGTDPDDDTTPSLSASPSASATPYAPVGGVTATDLDPEGDGEESPEEVGNAVDGDPATAWSTATYKQQLGPDGLKRGVGLVLDLGQTTTVRRVELTLEGRPTGVSLYVTADRPADVSGLTPAATVSAGTKQVVTLDQPASGRYLTVWLTSLPSVPGGFRGEVADVVVDR